MPRVRSETRNALVENAMHVFWRKGYAATSVSDLVEATGVGRGALYSDFGGKKELFLACLNEYASSAAGPGLAILEEPDADFSTVRRFVEFQADRLDRIARPLPGCFMANTLGEDIVRDTDISQPVTHHYQRLTRAFERAFENEADLRGVELSSAATRQLAQTATIAVQGLWSFARTARSMDEVRSAAIGVLETLERSLGCDVSC